MSSLMIGISGVRGIVGSELTPELCVRLGEAFGTYVDGGTVVVGRDTRPSGDMVKHAVFSGLLSAGCQIIDIGIVGTPTAAMMIRDLKADGGIVISASHNTIEWNALKFFRQDGVYLNGAEGRALLDIYYGGHATKVGWRDIKAVKIDNTANERHLKKVLDIIDVDAMRKRKFKVALDCCNGAGCELALAFLKEIDAEVSELYCEPHGNFSRNPEPTKANLTEICNIVSKNKCDIGFAQDADADRIAFVDENGSYIGEEYSMCLAADYILRSNPGPVVTNLSTTRMIEDVAAKYGCEVVRTAVGEVNVAEKMIEINSPAGGEGNGGVIDPRINYGREALTGMALILQYMIDTGETLSQLVAKIPTYEFVKTKVTCSKRVLAPVLERLANEKADSIDATDGVKLDFENGWVHVRSSNTEPIVRIYSEAKTLAQAEELNLKYKNLVEETVATAMAKKSGN